MRIDLQAHSTYSDGYLTPTELVNFLASKGVKVAALTDHNTVGGVEEFRIACKKRNIKPIVGLELYAKLRNKKINVLWFNFNPADPELHEMLRASQNRRRGQVRKILEKMVKSGFKIDINRILDKYNHYVSINHLIDDIVGNKINRAKIQKELGIKNFREEDVIHHYFYRTAATKLINSHIDLLRILKLRKRLGGQIIFNHPGKYNQLKKDLLYELKKLGIDGIEVLSPHHSIGAIMYAQFMAQELGFIMTGGSDFHKEESTYGNLKNSWQYFKIDSENLKGISKIIG